MDIDKLEAGRELDELILKKVFKDSVFEDGRGSRMAFFDEHRYSAKIAAAWEVVDKLCSIKEHGLRLYTFELFVSNDGCVSAEFNEHQSGHCDTAPLAICRAALKAVTGNI